jgi:hypothetical protein
MKRASGSKTRHALSLPFPPRTSAGWPTTCVFATVNEARRYLATSVSNDLNFDGGGAVDLDNGHHLLSMSQLSSVCSFDQARRVLLLCKEFSLKSIILLAYNFYCASKLARSVPKRDSAKQNND